MNYAYLRVSTAEQGASGGGLNAQRDQVQAYAKLNRLPIEQEFEDIAESRSKRPADRAGFLALLSVLSFGDTIIVANRDRLGEGLESALLERELAATGIRIISAQGVGNGDSPEDILSRRLQDAVSEYEHANIRRRTRSALQGKKARGKVYCKRLYGYARCGEDFVPDEKEQRVIADMQKMRDLGMSYNAIAKHLSKQKTPTPAGNGKWRHATVKSILDRQQS